MRAAVCVGLNYMPYVFICCTYSYHIVWLTKSAVCSFVLLGTTGDPLHSRALAHSRAPLFTQPCPHCSHNRENNEHGCVCLRCRAECKLPGCVEDHPWVRICPKCPGPSTCSSRIDIQTTFTLLTCEIEDLFQYTNWKIFVTQRWTQ